MTTDPKAREGATKPMKTEPFNDQLKSAMEKSILHHVQSGGWIMPDYANRIKLPSTLIQEVWELVDLDSLKRKLCDRIEQELADRVVNHIAAEMATDIKKILSVPERREAVRALAREHLESIMKKGEAQP